MLRFYAASQMIALSVSLRNFPLVITVAHIYIRFVKRPAEGLLGIAKDALQLLDLAGVLHHVVEGALRVEKLFGGAHPVGDALARQFHGCEGGGGDQC